MSEIARLDLSQQGLGGLLQDSILSKTLQALWLDENSLCAIPEEIIRFKQLKYLSCYHNQLT